MQEICGSGYSGDRSGRPDRVTGSNMIRKKICLWAAARAAAMIIIGCGGNSTYDQARTDLSQGAYEEASAGFEATIENGDHVAESYRGAGMAISAKQLNILIKLWLRMGWIEDSGGMFSRTKRPRNIKVNSMRRRWILVNVS